MSKIKCKLVISGYSGHLSQILTGFLMLERQGIIDLEISRTFKYRISHILEVQLNNQIKILYDVLDGYNISQNNMENSLEMVDFYFKRSYDIDHHKYFKMSEKIFPLGFNYSVTTQNDIFDKKDTGPFSLVTGFFCNKLLKQHREFNVEIFEDIPQKTNKLQILFTTRLWDPSEVKLGTSKISSNERKYEREYINDMRVDCINKLRKEFAGRFIGGVAPSNFAEKYFPEYVVRGSTLKRKNFIKLVKDSNICIATMGLLKSNGWKIGEYIAASKAIVSEKLHYSVPGNFQINKNYLEFNSSNECLEQTMKLAENTDYIYSMMVNNYLYYHNFLRPDRLVLNSLLLSLRKCKKSTPF